MKPNPGTYLGDGLLASFDGYQFWLRASDGIRITNEVALEPSVLDAFQDFIAMTCAKSKGEQE
jgi:hypothetical protein